MTAREERARKQNEQFLSFCIFCAESQSVPVSLISNKMKKSPSTVNPMDELKSVLNRRAETASSPNLLAQSAPTSPAPTRMNRDPSAQFGSLPTSPSVSHSPSDPMAELKKKIAMRMSVKGWNAIFF